MRLRLGPDETQPPTWVWWINGFIGGFVLAIFWDDTNLVGQVGLSVVYWTVTLDVIRLGMNRRARKQPPQ